MRLKAFRDGLRELGYVEGQNVELEFAGAKASLSGCCLWRPNWST